MLTLGIETSSNVGSVALLDDERLLAERTFERGMIHGRELVPSIQAILTEQKCALEQVGLIAVDIGPGSYTGLRVGLACAKGLSYAARKPLVGVVSLDALVEPLRVEKTRYLCPLIDARWAQVYTCLYENASGRLRCLTPHRAVAPAEWAKELPRENVLLFGDGLSRYGELFRQSGWRLGVPEMGIVHAATVALLGFQLYRDGKRDDPMTLTPLYLRPTEAEVKFGKKALDEKVGEVSR